MVTFKPRDCNNFASEAARIPLPKDEVTPPVTKINFAIITNAIMDYKGKTIKRNRKYLWI